MPSNADPSSEPKPPLRRWPLWLARLLLLIGAPLFVLGAAELGLRLVGYGYDTSFLIEDEADPEKVHDHQRFAWRFFPKALARTPQPIRVSKDKPTDCHRIIVFGGSAAMGDPAPAFGVPRVIERLLSARYPDEAFEVINAAVTAINSHVVLSVARDCAALDADLWVVYMGNNEVNGPYGSGSVFGKRRPARGMIQASLAYQETRIGQWMASLLNSGQGDGTVPKNWGGMKMFLDQQVPENAPDLKRVYANFEGNVKALLKEARKQDVPVILSSVAVNLEDSAPFASESVPGGDVQAWIDQLASLAPEEVVGRCQEAIDGEHARSALVHYCLGRALVDSGQNDEARVALQRACDLDTLRFRADSRINEILRTVAASEAEEGLYFLDGERLLADRDANGIPGREYFFEHVHFTSSGNYEIGLAMAQEVSKVLGLESAEPWLSQAECDHQLGWTSFHRREVLRDVRQRLSQPPFTGQKGHRLRDQEIVKRIETLGQSMTPEMGRQASRNFNQWIAERPHDWVLRQLYASLLGSMGQHKEAESQWEAVVGEVPHDPVSWFQLGSSRNRLQDWKGAEAALRKAIQWREAHPKAWNSLGISLSRQKRFDECGAAFAKAAEVDPGYAEPLMNWGLVLLNQGDRAAAKAKFVQAVATDPNHVPSLAQLAQCHTAEKDFAGAKKVYEDIVRRLPNDPGARVNLALVAMKLGDRERARAEFQEALRLDPGNDVARQGLERLSQ